MTRRRLCGACRRGAGGAARRSRKPAHALMTRAIPSSGERLPAVGLGTAVSFAPTTSDAAEGGRGPPGAGRGRRPADRHGVDLWRCRSRAGQRHRLRRPARQNLPRDQARRAGCRRSSSARSLGSRPQKLDLLQLHNVRSPHQSLAQFKEWKAQGVCRYIGITSTFHQRFRRGRGGAAQARSRISCRSTIRSTTAKRKNASCRLAADVKSWRADGAAVRPRPPVPRRARQGAPRLGAAVRRELGAVLPQIPARRSARNSRSFPAPATPRT